MAKHEQVTTHTFTTEDGIKLVVEFGNDRLISLYIQFPGSGKSPIQITPAEVSELASMTETARTFLVEHGIIIAPALATDEAA